MFSAGLLGLVLATLGVRGDVGHNETEDSESTEEN
jgi:hypothetical protein